jgi:hypothetical protein
MTALVMLKAYPMLDIVFRTCDTNVAHKPVILCRLSAVLGSLPDTG